LDEAGKACQGQTLKPIMKIHELRTKTINSIGPRINHQPVGANLPAVWCLPPGEITFKFNISSPLTTAKSNLMKNNGFLMKLVISYQFPCHCYKVDAKNHINKEMK
jgi:hypothetical protein